MIIPHILATHPKEYLMRYIHRFWDRITSRIKMIETDDHQIQSKRDVMLTWIETEGKDLLQDILQTIEESEVSFQQAKKITHWMRDAFDLADSFCYLPGDRELCVDMLLDWYAELGFRLKDHVFSVLSRR